MFGNKVSFLNALFTSHSTQIQTVNGARRQWIEKGGELYHGLFLTPSNEAFSNEMIRCLFLS